MSEAAARTALLLHPLDVAGRRLPRIHDSERDAVFGSWIRRPTLEWCVLAHLQGVKEDEAIAREQREFHLDAFRFVRREIDHELTADPAGLSSPEADAECHSQQWLRTVVPDDRVQADGP